MTLTQCINSKVLHPLIVLLTLFAAIGCRQAACPELLTADNIMESRPDSALVILQSVDTAALACRADKALHALLLTQAEVKCNVAITDSAKIHTAVDYFSAKGPKRNLMRAYFYEGVTMYYLGDHQRSMFDALSASDIAAELGETYWQAKASELIADNFTKNFNSFGALPYVEKAAELYEQSGYHLNHLFSLCDYAIDLGASLDRKRSEEIIDSIYYIAQNELCDSMLMAYCLHAQIPNARSLKKYDRVSLLCDKLREFNNYQPLDVVSYYALCLANLHFGDINEAEITSEKIKVNFTHPEDSTSLLQSEAYIAFARGDLESAFNKMEKLLNYEEAEFNRTATRSIIATQRDYFSHKALLEKEKNTRIRIYTIISICVLLVMVALISIIITMRFRYKNVEIERKVTEIWELSSQICSRNEENALLSRKLEKHEASDATRIADGLFKDHWHTINMLCNEFYQTDESTISSNRILHRIKTEINKITTQEEIDKIEKTINDLKDNLIVKIRQECTFLKESEITFLTFIIAGFHFRSICVLLNLTRANFYQKRTRIIARIQNSDAPNKELFIESLTLQQKDIRG